MLKVTLLPSILHRITMLLNAEELRQKIADETGLGVVKLPKGLIYKKYLYKLKEHESLETKAATLQVLGSNLAVADYNLFIITQALLSGFGCP